MAGPSKTTRIDRRRLSGLEVPEIENQDLRRSLEAMVEHFRTYEGQGQPRERFVTVDDLVRADIVTSVTRSGFAEITGGGVAASGSSEGTFAGLSDVDVPGAKAGWFTRFNGAKWTAFNFDVTPRVVNALWSFEQIITHGADINMANTTAINWLNAASAPIELLTFEDSNSVANGDPLFNSVGLLAIFEGIDNQTTYISEDSNAFVFTFTNNADLNILQKPFIELTTSLRLDGTTDYVGVPNDVSLQMAGVDFTMEAWIRFNGIPSGGETIISKWLDNGSGSKEWFFGYRGSGNLEFVYTINGTAAITGISEAWSPAADTWYHVAVTRSGDAIRLFIDGTQLGSDNTSIGTSIIASTTAAVNIGTFLNPGPNEDFDGWISNARITKGTARYTINFVAPTTSFPTFLASVSVFDIGDPVADTVISGASTTITSPLTTLSGALTVNSIVIFDSTLAVAGTSLFSDNMDIIGQLEVASALIDLNNSAAASASSILNRNSNGGVSLGIIVSGAAQIEQTSDAGVSEGIWANFIRGAQVQLRFNNVLRFETTNSGVSVLGEITVSGLVDGRDIAGDGLSQDAHIADGSTHFTQASISITESQISDLQTYALDSDAVHVTGSETINGIKTFSDVVVYGSYAQYSTFTDAQLNDIADTVNTDAGKIQGAMVYNLTQDAPVYAVGDTDGSIWVDGAGATANTPV